MCLCVGMCVMCMCVAATVFYFCVCVFFRIYVHTYIP
jgi:hypothetical protein